MRVLLGLTFLLCVVEDAKAQNFWIPAEDFESHTNRTFQGTLETDPVTNKQVLSLDEGEQVRIILGVDSDLEDFVDPNIPFEVCAVVANEEAGVTNTVRAKHLDNSLSKDHATTNQGYRTVCSDIGPLNQQNVLSAGLKVLDSDGAVKVRGVSFRPDDSLIEPPPTGETLVAFVSKENVKPNGASRNAQLHVVGPNGDYEYVWGNPDNWTGNAIDMDTNDELGLIVVGGGQGNINNEVLLYDYDGNKQWEADSNGNSQGTLFYKGSRAEPMIAVGFHDNKAESRPNSGMNVEVLGFYTRDIEGELLDWNPQFTDGGGPPNFRGGGLNVWHMFGDEVNNRLFVQGEFSSVRTTSGGSVSVPASRLAMYEQRNNGTFPEVPTPIPLIGASWFVNSFDTKHVGNPWDMTQTDEHYYVGGHSFDRVKDLGGTTHQVSSLLRLNMSDFDYDDSWTPEFGPAYDAATTTAKNCVSIRALETYGNQVLVGGRFESVDGEARANLAAFNANTGALSPRFSNISVNGGEVYSIAIDGDFAYIAGSFTSITDQDGSVSRRGVACIDLRTDTVTSWNPNVPARVVKIRVIQAD